MAKWSKELQTKVIVGVLSVAVFLGSALLSVVGYNYTEDNAYLRDTLTEISKDVKANGTKITDNKEFIIVSVNKEATQRAEGDLKLTKEIYQVALLVPKEK